MQAINKKTHNFSGKTVIITGGSRGIGFTTAKMFISHGAKVSFCGLEEESVAQALRKLSTNDSVFGITTDVRGEAKVKSFIQETVKKFGSIDILVNNAGVLWSGDFENQSTDTINQLIDTNIKGVLFTTSAVLPVMKKKRSGVIINVSSGAGKSGIPGLVTYCTTKFAVIGFTESLSLEMENYGIKVYAICPGSVATDMIVQFAGRKFGMPPEKIARNILNLSGANPPINAGECLEVYS